MSSVTDRQHAHGETLRPSVRLGDTGKMAGLSAGATALTLLMNAPLVATVWRGGFADPDDAMRLVEVRSWMGGQAWFDVSVSRLDPPYGASMHWSRLVDLPSALLIRIFGLVTDAATAERLACVVLPTLWLLALYIGMARLATLLLGRTARAPALLGTLFSGAVLVQFAPGRIGHHAPETVALVFAVHAALASLDPARTRQAMVAGVLMALSLAMSLETLPFLGALCAAMVAAWVLRGATLAPTLAHFATGLAVALALFFVLTVPPGNWFAPVCDAFGAAHLGAGLIGAAGLWTSARGTEALPSAAARLITAGAIAAVVVAYVAYAYPSCAHSPFAGVDPLVKSLWLDRVVESKPLLAFMRERPMTGLAITLPLVFGLVGSLAAAMSRQGVTRLRFGAVAGLAALGLALGFWQVRVFASVTPLALCGGLFAVVAVRDRLAARGLSLAAMLTPALILPFTATAWALFLPADASLPRGQAACLTPEALAPLAALPPGRAVAPINVGSHLLLATKLDPFAAPYHRNNDGNRFAFEALLAPPDAALALLQSRRVAYVLTCPLAAARGAARVASGLEAQLEAGKIPAWLTPVPLSETPLKVYAVTPSAR